MMPSCGAREFEKLWSRQTKPFRVVPPPTPLLEQFSKENPSLRDALDAWRYACEYGHYADQFGTSDEIHFECHEMDQSVMNAIMESIERKGAEMITERITVDDTLRRIRAGEMVPIRCNVGPYEFEYKPPFRLPQRKTADTPVISEP